MLKKAGLLTRPTLVVISPSRPESAKTASSPRDAPFPKQGRSVLSLYKGWVGWSQLRAIFHPPSPQRAKTRFIPGEGLPISYTSL